MRVLESFHHGVLEIQAISRVNWGVVMMFLQLLWKGKGFGATAVNSSFFLLKFHKSSGIFHAFFRDVRSIFAGHGERSLDETSRVQIVEFDLIERNI